VPSEKRNEEVEAEGINRKRKSTAKVRLRKQALWIFIDTPGIDPWLMGSSFCV
jgi:hypothetical protein